MWSQLSSQCPNNYPFLQPSATDRGGNYCLTLIDWSASGVTSRYASNPSCSSVSGDFTSSSAAILAYYNGLTKYITDNMNLLKNLNTQMDTINVSFNSSTGKILGSLTNINNALKQLIELFQQATGPEGLTSTINCSKFVFKFRIYSK